MAKQKKRVDRFVTGPWVGMRDSLDPSVSRDPSRARLIQNMFPLELNKPSTFYGRPGFDQAGAQGGASAKRTSQLLYQFTKRDGTEYTVRIVGGQGIQTYDWSTETWSTVVSVANLTTASITLSETARCYAVTFADKMVISDGVNVPFTWDGSSGDGGLTELTASPVMYGQPWIYYAKLFGIKDTARNTVVWSEENDPTIGYETSPYNNAWELGQTDQEGLYAGVGRNDVQYYLRARSSGSIRGAVTPEFTSDGTHEGVSQNVGTTSPDGACVVGERVFFIDADARPHVIDGGQVVPLFDDVRETIRSLDTTKLSLAITRYDPTTGLVLFGVTETGHTGSCSAILAYNPVLNVPVSIWRGFTFQALAVVKDGNGVPVLMHGDSDGYTYDHGTLDGTLWDDELNAGTTAIAHALEAGHLGVDPRYERRYSRADIVVRAEEDATGINVKHFTPYGASTAVSGSVESSEARYGASTSLYGTTVYGSGVVERRLPVGLRAVGRWIRPRVDHQVTGEQFGLTAMAVEGAFAGDHWEAA